MVMCLVLFFFSIPPLHTLIHKTCNYYSHIQIIFITSLYNSETRESLTLEVAFLSLSDHAYSLLMKGKDTLDGMMMMVREETDFHLSGLLDQGWLEANTTPRRIIKHSTRMNIYFTCYLSDCIYFTNGIYFLDSEKD